MNLPPTLRKLTGPGVTFSRPLLKDGNLLSRPQPEAVLAPVSYRLSRRRRQRKRLLLKVPNGATPQPRPQGFLLDDFKMAARWASRHFENRRGESPGDEVEQRQ